MISGECGMFVKCNICGKIKPSCQMFKIKISSDPTVSPVGICKMCKGEVEQ
jgi:hypothetical protein